jgi:hypothetical protein
MLPHERHGEHAVVSTPRVRPMELSQQRGKGRVSAVLGPAPDIAKIAPGGA